MVKKQEDTRYFVFDGMEFMFTIHGSGDEPKSEYSVRDKKDVEVSVSEFPFWQGL